MMTTSGMRRSEPVQRLAGRGCRRSHRGQGPAAEGPGHEPARSERPPAGSARAPSSDGSHPHPGLRRVSASVAAPPPPAPAGAPGRANAWALATRSGTLPGRRRRPRARARPATLPRADRPAFEIGRLDAEHELTRLELDDVDLLIWEQVVDCPLERRRLLVAGHAVEDQLNAARTRLCWARDAVSGLAAAGCGRAAVRGAGGPAAGGGGSRGRRPSSSLSATARPSGAGLRRAHPARRPSCAVGRRGDEISFSPAGPARTVPPARRGGDWPARTRATLPAGRESLAPLPRQSRSRPLGAERTERIWSSRPRSRCSIARTSPSMASRSCSAAWTISRACAFASETIAARHFRSCSASRRERRRSAWSSEISFSSCAWCDGTRRGCSRRLGGASSSVLRMP